MERQRPTTATARSRPSRAAAGLALALLAACGGTDTAPQDVSEDVSGAVSQAPSTSGTAAGAPTTTAIDGLEEYGDLSRDHVDGPVDYEQDPPVGGPHAPVWQNCGSYDTPVADENAVHSLEHGAVWLAHDPGLADEQVAELRARSAVSTHVLVSPREGLASPVVATAWGVQVELDGADDERLDPFLDTYTQGPQTPEPGVTCGQGLGEPLG